jgi:hypothetical protein
MKWEDTIAHSCRWSELVGEVLDLDNAEIVWESSEADYQGFAKVVAVTKDDKIIHYEWSYGSCSGCDAWEDEPVEEVKGEIKKTASILYKGNYKKYKPFESNPDIVASIESYFSK